MSPHQKLHNMVLDWLYSQICLKKTNQEIFRMMESKSFPSMDNDQLEAIRIRFKEKELANPLKMHEFRKRLKV